MKLRSVDLIHCHKDRERSPQTWTNKSSTKDSSSNNMTLTPSNNPPNSKNGKFEKMKMSEDATTEFDHQLSPENRQQNDDNPELGRMFCRVEKLLEFYKDKSDRLEKENKSLMKIIKDNNFSSK